MGGGGVGWGGWEDAYFKKMYSIAFTVDSLFGPSVPKLVCDRTVYSLKA